MKKLLAVLSGVVVLIALTFWLAMPRKSKADTPSQLSRVAGFFDSTQYKWSAYVLNGNSATGAQTITVCPGIFSLPDGRTFQPFAAANTVFSPFTIDPQGSTVETVTPTASSLVYPSNAPGNVPCANVTATFSNTHGASFTLGQVSSGDQNIQEAINDASLNGGGMVHWVIDPGIVTLNTGGANTNLGSINIPTRSTVVVATAKVTTTIATCAGGWSLGESTGTEFGAANTTLTAGTTTDSSTLATPFIDNLAAALPIAHCTTSNASAGALHPHFEGWKLAAPAN